MTEDLPARYVSGQLSETAQDEFEQHYFECERCFEAVRICQTVQSELSQNAPEAKPARFPTWKAFAAAAVLLLTVGVIWIASHPENPQQSAAQRATEPAPPAVEQLAQFTPPEYVKPALRAAGSSDFDSAMRLYQQHDFTGAIGALRKIAAADTQDQAARFYLGISYLMAGKIDDGIRLLQETLGLGGSSYIESAHFYLAKAYLREKDLEAARTELKSIIELHGDMEAQARDLLDAINAAARQ